MARHFDNTKAVDAFLAAKAEIDDMLARMVSLSEDRFNTDPDEINWGHVGLLHYYSEHLRRITDAAFREGEHAA